MDPKIVFLYALAFALQIFPSLGSYGKSSGFGSQQLQTSDGNNGAVSVPSSPESGWHRSYGKTSESPAGLSSNSGDDSGGCNICSQRSSSWSWKSPITHWSNGPSGYSVWTTAPDSDDFSTSTPPLSIGSKIEPPGFTPKWSENDKNGNSFSAPKKHSYGPKKPSEKSKSSSAQKSTESLAVIGMNNNEQQPQPPGMANQWPNNQPTPQQQDQFFSPSPSFPPSSSSSWWTEGPSVMTASFQLNQMQQQPLQWQQHGSGRTGGHTVMMASMPPMMNRQQQQQHQMPTMMMIHPQQQQQQQHQMPMMPAVSSSGGPGNGMPTEMPMPFGYLPPEAREAMIKTCKESHVDCKSATPEMSEKRSQLLRFEMDSISKISPFEDAQKMASQRLDMVFHLKTKMLKVGGLGDHVAAVNDGTFEHDILLSDKQSSEMMRILGQMPDSGVLEFTPQSSTNAHEQKQQQSSTNTRYGYGYGGKNGGGSWQQQQQRSKRGLSLFLDGFPVQKWDLGQPIPYFFDENIAEFERNMVRQAHQMIESNTCIRFQASESKPSGSYIYYVKVASPSFCGLSYIGKVDPANPVYLSFMCQDPVGIAIHETMHALGANHEHLRSDRENYIDIEWSNINPQFYDFFAISDPNKFTPYGTQYDFGSIMHYNAFMAAVDRSKPTMAPKQNREVNIPLMGQRKSLSQYDIDLLNSMYCKDCADRNIHCGIWAVRGFCYRSWWMQQNCFKSCKLC